MTRSGRCSIVHSARDCDGFVMEVSNSYGIGTLKFDDTVGVLLSEEARKKSSGAVETLGSALSVRKSKVNEQRKKRIANSNLNLREAIPDQDVPGVGIAVRKGHIQRDCKKKRMEMGKAKRRILYMSWAVMNLML